MTKTVVKVTPNKAVVKVVDANATISLATDLLFTGQTVSGTPKVYITGVWFCCDGNTHIHVTRNSVDALKLSYASKFEFPTFAITENATSDIVITCPANSMVILELSKTEGYSDVIANIGA